MEPNSYKLGVRFIAPVEPEYLYTFGAFPQKYFTGSPRRGVMRWIQGDTIIERSRERSADVGCVVDIIHPKYLISAGVEVWDFDITDSFTNFSQFSFVGDANIFETDVLLFKLEQE